MTSKEIMQKAINTYGVENQIIKTVEELSELSQALCKSLVRLNYTKEKTSLEDDLKSVDNIFEEMADVEIMLEQCKIMFQCDKEVSAWKHKKIERLERRLEKISSSIAAIPKADAQEVKHAKWNKVHEHIILADGSVKEWDNFFCSNCEGVSDCPTKYCPCCGAKMNKE